MRITRLFLVVVGLLVLLAQAALADGGPSGMPQIPSTAVPQYAPLPAQGGVGSTAATKSGGVAGTGRTAQPEGAKKPRITKRCHWSRRHHRGTRTCKFYANHRLFKKCVKKPHRRERCKAAHARARRAATGGARARTAGTFLGEGFLHPSLGSVVRIYWSFTATDGRTWNKFCSGSIIARGLILTAGHCVYSNGPDGSGESGFVGYYPVGTYTIVPNNYWNGTQGVAPNGEWSARHTWTTNEYASGLNGQSVGGDWGIIEVNPDAQGRYPGDVFPGVKAEWDQTTIDDLYSVGYSGMGFFSSAEGGEGNAQYYCEDTWDPGTPQAPGDHLGDVSFDGYYDMVIQPCQETGGASGGPVYTYTAEGWVVVGVNNRGGPNIAQGDTTSVGQRMISFWFDDNFGVFWNAVIDQVNQGV